MATRVIQQMVQEGSMGPPSQPGYAPRWYALMTDGTLWQFIGGVWTQAPPVPGGRVVNAIQIVPALYDTVYAATTDGSIFAATITTPFVWTQVASTP